MLKSLNYPMTDLFMRLQCMRSPYKAQLGFTVTLQSHCVPGCPPVSQRLDHCGPVCQLVDICLLPPPSVVMAATPSSLLPPDPSLPLAGRPSPPLSRVSPRHQLWTTYAYPAVHLVLSYGQPAQHSFWNCHCTHCVHCLLIQRQKYTHWNSIF